MAERKHILVFDFDGTLYDGDSYIDFAKRVCGARKLYCGILLNIFRLSGMFLGVYSHHKAKQAVYSYLYNGMKYSDFKRAGEDFVPLINSHLKKDIYDIAQKAKADGKDVYVVSASIAEWVEPWCKQNDFHCIATNVEVDDSDLLTGRFSTPNCRAEEKVHRLETVLPFPRSSYYVEAYGDSRSDRYILDWADCGKLIV